MTALGPILCATDFSGPARAAADRAGHLAQETGAALTLMHVVPGGRLADLRRRLGPDPAPGQPVHDDVEARLKMLSGELAATWSVQARTMHAVGSVVDEILFEASALQADILVVGARGAGNLRRLFLGTTAERLLRRATRPVLVVRQPPEAPYRRVLVAVDFSAASAAALAAAQRVAAQAHLVLLHVVEPAAEQVASPGAGAATVDAQGEAAAGEAHADAAGRMRELADAAGLAQDRWEARIVEGGASERLLEHEQGCSLVVMGKHGRTLTEQLLLGSVTHHVLAEGVADLLILPAAPA